uniref:uncharacterized protein isoform X2 n=1 Tax=Pristiophorus japonicus TaxID=55135 RepID=UPI00398EC96F
MMWKVLVPLVLVWVSPVSCNNATRLEEVDDDSGDELLLCRSCGLEVATSRDLQFVASPLALRQSNDTVIGERRVPAQLFQNLQGLRFQLLTFKRAAVHKHWPADEQFSWFPGHSWTVATCPRCHSHLGHRNHRKLQHRRRPFSPSCLCRSKKRYHPNPAFQH